MHRLERLDERLAALLEAAEPVDDTRHIARERDRLRKVSELRLDAGELRLDWCA